MDMKTRYYLLMAAAALVATVSCSRLLDIEQHGVIAIDDFYQTDEQVESANAETYNLFRAQPNGSGTMGLSFYGCMEWAWICVKEAASDNVWAGGGTRPENTDGYQVAEWSLDSNNPATEIYYTLLNTLVYRANLVLDRAPEGQSNKIDMFRAEARVFRAWAYFELTTLWGNPPLVDHVLAQDEYKVSNATQEELFAFMEADLTAAINSGRLSEKSSADDKTTWRITKQFAQTLLGKVYLWEGKNSESASVLESVINSGKYRLFTKADGNYGDMSHPQYNFNCESLFQLNRVADVTTAQGGNLFNMGTVSELYFSPRGGMFDWSGSTTGGVVNGTELSPGQTASDIFFYNGWGIGVPTQDLYDAFKSEEGENGYRFKQTLRNYHDMQKGYGLRLLPTANVLGDSVFMWKFRHVWSDRQGAAAPIGTNWTVMRYAETLLLAAEANLAAGNASKAAEYLNMVRERAGLPAKSGVTLKDIQIEKRLELCYEGSRTQDMMRWKDISTFMANKGGDFPYVQCKYDPNHEQDPSYDTVIIEIAHPYAGAGEYGYHPDKKPYLPFPKGEIDANPNMTQNPGY